MNITHVVESLNCGGLERVVVDLSLQQVRDGHHVQVACIFEAGTLAQELEQYGIRVYSCNKGRGIDVTAVRSLRQFIKAFKTNVLHTHNAVAHYYAIAAARSGSLGCVVNTRHGMGGLKSSRRMEILYRLTMPWTDVTVAVCRAARDEFVRHRIFSPTKARVVHNGIRVETIPMRSWTAKQEFLRSLDLPVVTKIVGTVGRLNPAKDHSTLIKAFSLVTKLECEALLVIVGDGPSKSETAMVVRNLGVEDRVVFLGERRDVASLLQTFDVFALSSVTEGYSIALLEASTAGLPIAATNVGGNSEIITHGKNGLLVDAGDPVYLARALTYLLANPQKASELGNKARAWALASASLSNMAKRYYSVYKSDECLTHAA